MEETPIDLDSDSERSCFSETIPLPPTRILPRRGDCDSPPTLAFAQTVASSNVPGDCDSPTENLYAVTKERNPVQKERKRSEIIC